MFKYLFPHRTDSKERKMLSRTGKQSRDIYETISFGKMYTVTCCYNVVIYYNKRAFFFVLFIKRRKTQEHRRVNRSELRQYNALYLKLRKNRNEKNQTVPLKYVKNDSGVNSRSRPRRPSRRSPIAILVLAWECCGVVKRTVNNCCIFAKTRRTIWHDDNRKF